MGVFSNEVSPEITKNRDPCNIYHGQAVREAVFRTLEPTNMCLLVMQDSQLEIPAQKIFG